MTRTTAGPPARVAEDRDRPPIRGRRCGEGLPIDAAGYSSEPVHRSSRRRAHVLGARSASRLRVDDAIPVPAGGPHHAHPCAHRRLPRPADTRRSRCPAPTRCWCAPVPPRRGRRGHRVGPVVATRHRGAGRRPRRGVGRRRHAVPVLCDQDCSALSAPTRRGFLSGPEWSTWRGVCRRAGLPTRTRRIPSWSISRRRRRHPLAEPHHCLEASSSTARGGTR